MLHNIIQIALGVCYGIYLAFLAPASVRQQAYNWAKQQDTAANLDKQPVFFQVESTVVASKPELLVDAEPLEDPWLAEPSFTIRLVRNINLGEKKIVGVFVLSYHHDKSNRLYP